MSSQDTRERRRPGQKPRPATSTPTVDTAEHISGLHRRRAAAQRLPVLDCGCRDPWPCRCNEAAPSEAAVDGYRATVAHLASQGYPAAARLPELRCLHRRGGEDRLLAQKLVQRWAVAEQ